MTILGILLAIILLVITIAWAAFSTWYICKQAGVLPVKNIWSIAVLIVMFISALRGTLEIMRDVAEWVLS